MIIISHKASKEFKIFLKDNKFEYIETINNPNLDPRIADHPDLSIFAIDAENIVVANEVYDYYRSKIRGVNLIKGQSTGHKYPYDAIYNCLIFDKFFIHNDITENHIKNYVETELLRHLLIKQGYSRCSIIPMKDRLLTSDYGIYKKLNKEINIILLEEENIKLDGFDKGFIGGTCGRIGDKILFTGNIKKLKSYDLIKINSKESGDKILYPDCELVDIGSIISV